MNLLDSIRNVDLGVSARYLMNATTGFAARSDALTVFATSKVAIGVFVGVALLAGLTLYYCTRKVKPIDQAQPQQRVKRVRDPAQAPTVAKQQKHVKQQTSQRANAVHTLVRSHKGNASTLHGKSFR